MRALVAPALLLLVGCHAIFPFDSVSSDAGGSDGTAEARVLDARQDGGGTDAPADAKPGTDAPADAKPGTDAPADAKPGTDAPADAEPGIDTKPADAKPGTDSGPGPVHAWSKGSVASFDALGNAVAVDSSGNVYLAASYYGTIDVGGGPQTAVLRDALVLSLSPSGAYRWSKILGGAGLDSAEGVAVDSAGNVHAAGYFEDTVDLGGGPVTAKGSHDIFVVSYTAAGGYRWAKAFGSPDSDQALAVTAGNSVNVTGYVTGTLSFGAGNLSPKGGMPEIFLVNLTQSGGYGWADLFGAAMHDIGRGVAVDSADNVYLTGGFRETVDFGGGPLTSAGDYDIVVASFTAGGGHRWSKRYGGTGIDRGQGIAADASGNVHVAGGFNATVDLGGGACTSAGAEDLFLASYTAAGGAYRWAKPFGGTAYDQANAVAVDSAGNVYFAGYYEGTVDFGGGPLASQSRDIFVVSYTSGGVHRWSRRFGGSGMDGAWGIAVDGSGNVYLTGYFSGTVDFGGGPLAAAGVKDLFVLKLAP